ncbi:MAG: PKD domain-containing protein, partial [Acidobacteriota bacterium]
NPAAPQLITTFDSEGFYSHISVVGTTAVIANYLLGIEIVDVSDPASPYQLAANNTDGNALQVVVSGTIAYVADGSGGLQIVDLSDRSGFPLLGAFGTRDSTRDLAVSDHNVYVADQAGGLQIIDASDPAHPRLLGSVEVPGGAWGVDVVGSLVYVAQQEQQYGVLIIDAGDPENPEVLSSINTPGYATDVRVVGNTAYVADGTAGLGIYDVSVPQEPQLLGEYTIEPGTGQFKHVEVEGGIAYVAAGHLGLEIIDVSDPANPTHLNTYTSGGPVEDVAVQDSIATIAHGSDGVSIVDLQVPGNPQTRTTFYTNDRANGIAVSGGLVYVADGLNFEIFTTGCQAPRADFDVESAGPNAVFRDRSLFGVSSLSWDFGDGSTSEAAQPLHLYASAGTYTVSMTATNDFGSATASKTIYVGQSSPGIDNPGAFVSVLSGAANISGSSGTNWVSDLVLWNPSGSTVNANLFFLESERDNSDVQGRSVSIESWHSIKFGDVVGTVFGRNRAAGAILVGGNQQLKTSLRTYNDAASGTFGQFIAGLAAGEAIGPAQPARLIQLTRNDDYRTNIGFSNASDNTVTVNVDLYRNDGSQIATHSYEIEPFGFFQKTDIIGTDVEDAYAIVESSTPDADYFTYASVVDNRTGDPVFIMPDSPVVSAGESLFIPTSAHVAGAGGTVWRTDLEIHNPGASQATYTIELLERNQPNPDPSSSDFTLNAGAGVRYTDVLGEIFGFDGAAALRITPTQGTITASSRTYNQTPEGTYGQFIPAVTAGAAIDSVTSLPLTHLSESGSQNQGYRTNIGFLNITNQTFDVRVDLYDENGVLLDMKVVTLRPFEHKQVDRIFRPVASGGLDNCYAHVSTAEAEGRFLAYGSVIDNRSGDPVYIPAAE